jgi:hypothetical protein
MLRNKKEIVLNELLVAVKKAADLYETVTTMEGASRLTSAYIEFATIRREQAALLEKQIRDKGYLPAEPDQDRETLEHLLIRFKSFFASDKEVLVLRECRNLEKEITNQVDMALQGEITPEENRLLAAIKQQARNIQDQMESLQSSG